jgi:hypothetical protein
MNMFSHSHGLPNTELAIQSSSFDQARLGQLFLDIKYHLVTEFLDYNIEFCPRACNKPAHVFFFFIEKKMYHNAHSLWVSDYPDDVTRLVAGDIVVS